MSISVTFSPSRIELHVTQFQVAVQRVAGATEGVDLSWVLNSDPTPAEGARAEPKKRHRSDKTEKHVVVFSTTHGVLASRCDLYEGQGTQESNRDRAFSKNVSPHPSRCRATTLAGTGPL